MKKTSFFVLFWGFAITSPRFLTDILSPSVVPLDVFDGRRLKSDNTPVILNSTFLLRSPSSYPKINSSDLTSSVDEIVVVIPEQFRNWFTVLSVYVTVFIPDMTLPVVLNPTVESTVITDDPIGTSPIAFDFPGTVNVPKIPLRSLYPTNKLNL